MLHVPGLYLVEDNLKGRSVYSSEKLEKGDLIEICPVIKIVSGELKFIDKTILHDYYFLWGEEGFEACIALGYGSLYNHNGTPNADITLDYSDSTIRVICSKVINEGEEITIDYTGGTKGIVKLWFDVK